MSQFDEIDLRQLVITT